MIALIVIACILVIIITLILTKAITLHRLRKRIAFTRNYCDNDIGYITYVCGAVGAGKTTLACGITNNLNLTLIKKAESTIENFTTTFYDYDFNRAYQIIFENYKEGKVNPGIITKLILKEEQYKNLGNIKYSNYLVEEIPAFKMLESFVEAFLALIRNNYVYYYNCGFYSHITGNYAMNFTPDMIEIKDRAKQKDYQILTYSIIFEDEKQISNKISTNYQQVAREDGGSDLFLRLIRQLGKGTIYYITTSQEFGRAVKVERMLATSILYITKRKIVNPYNVSNLLLSCLIWTCKLILSLKNLILSRDEPIEYLFPSILKKIIFRAKQKKKEIFSNSYLEYKCIKYNNAEDVGKRLDYTAFGGEEVILTFPLEFCFGSIDTHAFSVVQDYLVNSSKKKPKKSKDKPEVFAKNILKKKEKQTENKETVKKSNEEKPTIFKNRILKKSKTQKNSEENTINLDKKGAEKQ